MADLSPIRVYVGDDWRVQVALVDAAGDAIDLAGASVGAEFWPAFSAAPVDLGAAGGGVSVVRPFPALVLLTVPRAVTAGVAEQSVLAKAFPTRARVYVDATLGRRQTATVVPFQPLAPRTTDLPAAAAAAASVVAVLAPQGPAGPSAIPRSFAVQIAARGQAVIPMPSPPLRLSSVALEVNGSLFRPPLIAASDTAVTWLNPDFVLEPSDVVTLTFV